MILRLLCWIYVETHMLSPLSYIHCDICMINHKSGKTCYFQPANSSLYCVPIFILMPLNARSFYPPETTTTEMMSSAAGIYINFFIVITCPYNQTFQHSYTWTHRKHILYRSSDIINLNEREVSYKGSEYVHSVTDIYNKIPVLERDGCNRLIGNPLDVLECIETQSAATKSSEVVSFSA